MAPIPEENQDKPPDGNKDDSEIGHFSNPNLAFPIETTDSSDDDSEDNIGAPSGYSLLPQEPGEHNDEYSNDDEDDGFGTAYNAMEDTGDSIHQPSVTRNTSGADEENTPTDLLPEAVMSSEAGASAPTVSASSESCHPAFLAKFPDGKIPSYMQVPQMPKPKEAHLWNQQRQDTHRISMDSAQESKILKAMSGFSLPKESIPEWARNLPDDQWRQQVVHRIGSSSPERQSENVVVKQWAEASRTEKTNNTQETVSNADNSWVAEFPDSDTNKQ